MADDINSPNINNKKPKVIKSNLVNPLNSYSSYNYIFTLASLRKEALTDPDSYRNESNYFVIAKSSGKGTKGLSSNVSTIDKTFVEDIKNRGGEVIGKNTKTFSSGIENGATLVQQFNKESPGRFDFYIDNVQIDTIMGFNEQTSLAVSTNIEFGILEPYSMSGFIEALQVSAVAAGYEQYTLCPYLLKMEFKGYPDGQSIAESAVTVENSTRYFVFGFTSLDITVTELGAKYKCTGVPFNEKGYGLPSTLTTSVTLTGNTVGELLKDFEKALNENRQAETGAEKGSKQATRSDSYEIIIPKVDSIGKITGEVNKSITESKIIELLKSNAIYAFSPPAMQSSAEDARLARQASPTQANTIFSEGSKINECISSIVLNSEYVKNIIKDLSSPNTKIVDPYGMVDYFIVNLEVEDTGRMDDSTNKPFYHYRYVVLPYKVHYSRIPLVQNATIDTSKLISVANRSYDYLYTGNNVDIKSFQLKFNHLFFQAIPKSVGNNPEGYHLTSESVESTSPSTISMPNTTSEARRDSMIGKSKSASDPRLLNVQSGNIANSGQATQADPYARLARNMHQAILDNVDQCQAEIEIIGDPYYLVTGGIGNYRPTLNPDKTAGQGEAPYTSRDVIIVLTFRNPIDISETTGEAIFSDKVTPYSGAFRVISVVHMFNGGVFTQRLTLIRIPGQLNIDTNYSKTTRPGIVNSTENESQASTEVPPAPPNTVRKSATNLFSSIANEFIPSTGLPGSLSKLASSVGGTLAGVQAATNTVGSLLNTVTGGSGSALQGLENFSSALRLSQSGLSALSTNINSAGASVAQMTNIAQSAGVQLSNATDLASTILASGKGAVDQLGANALSAVTNLGSQASGLISSVSAKIDGLKGSTELAFASQLGVDTSKLSGLSAELQSKFTQQISEVTKAIPSGTDIAGMIKSGLILENIPVANLANLPASQPAASAPPAVISLKDIKAILDQGGSIANLPGVANIAGVADLLKSASLLQLPGGVGADIAALSGKISTVQAGISSITGQFKTVEAQLNNVASMVPGGLPNVADISLSVSNKFGSISSAISSPLDTLMKSKS